MEHGLVRSWSAHVIDFVQRAFMAFTIVIVPAPVCLCMCGVSLSLSGGGGGAGGGKLTKSEMTPKLFLYKELQRNESS